MENNKINDIKWRHENIDRYTETLNKVKTLLECHEVIEDIMRKYQMDEETAEEYIISRGYLVEIANM